jgi:hypothetical protein
MINQDAIMALYPNVTLVADEDAFDKDGNPVIYDRALVEAWVDPNEYKWKRELEYPKITDYLDGIVKGDQAQIQTYIDACLAVKEKYPKPNL